jgi:hypothetical protein
VSPVRFRPLPPFLFIRRSSERLFCCLLPIKSTSKRPSLFSLFAMGCTARFLKSAVSLSFTESGRDLTRSLSDLKVTTPVCEKSCCPFVNNTIYASFRYPYARKSLRCSSQLSGMPRRSLSSVSESGAVPFQIILIRSGARFAS